MKSGSIAGSGSDSALTAQIAPSSPTVLTLGALVAAILANSLGNQVIAVDFQNRKVANIVYASGVEAALLDAVDGATSFNALPVVFEMEDDTKSSSVWTLVQDDLSLIRELDGDESAATYVAALEKQFGRVNLPVKSGASMIGSIEDALMATAETDTEWQGILILNQENKTAKLYVHRGTLANIFTTAGAWAPTGKFAQTISSNSAPSGFWAL